jgi:NADH-quinone oxidoreductase subunit N
LTATFGNLAAYMQSNLKRLLAYSTIAHAGYMMMGLATMTREGLGATLFYLAAYLFMNLGAFAVVAFLRNQTGSEDLASFRGLVQRSPAMVITLAVFLLSLLGLPPLAGFAAKFQVFRSLYDAGRAYADLKQVGLSNLMFSLLVIGGINTVISAVYYLKVLKVMILDRPLEDVEGVQPASLREPAGSVVYAGLLAVVILLMGVYWGPVAAATGTSTGVASHYRLPPPVVRKLPPPPTLLGGGDRPKQ